MRLLSLYRRILRQFRRDPRTLALILVAPCLVLGLFALLLHGAPYRPRIGLVEVPPKLEAQLRETNARVQVLAPAAAERELRAGRLDAIFRLQKGRIHVTLEGSDPAASQAVQLALLEVVRRVKPPKLPAVVRSMLPEGLPTGPPEITQLRGKKTLSMFDSFGPVLLGFMVFFFTFIVSGVSLVRERTSGTLERMLSTPLRRWEVVLGYGAGFATVVMVQATVITLVSVYLLDMVLAGSFLLLLLITLMLSATAMTFGMLLSAYASSEFQLFQFIPLVIIPQIFFTGLFNLESSWLRILGYLMPMSHGSHAMREVMVRGGGLGNITQDLLALAAFIVGFMVLNTLVLRRYRQI